MPSPAVPRATRRKKATTTVVGRTDSHSTECLNTASDLQESTACGVSTTTSKPIEKSAFTLRIEGAERQFSSMTETFDFLVGRGNIQLTTSQPSEVRSMDQCVSTAATSANCSDSRAIFVGRERPVSISTDSGVDVVRVTDPALTAPDLEQNVSTIEKCNKVMKQTLFCSQFV